MLRLWVFFGSVITLFYVCPMAFLFYLFLCFSGTLGITSKKKFVMKNKESLISLWLNSIWDVMKQQVSLLEKTGFISDIEALRLPTYLTYLLKPCSEVDYEKLTVCDDSINIIVYRPKNVDNDGCVIYMHGGGWVLFTARMFHSAVSYIANECRTVVISVDYHRAPEFPFPRPLQDCFYVTKWAQLNAAKLGIDPAKVVIAGDSSGGSLAAATCIMHRDIQSEQFPPIKAQVLIYPVLQAYSYTTPSYTNRVTLGLRKYVSYYIAGDLSLLDVAGDLTHYSGAPKYWQSLIDTSLTDDLAVTKSLRPSPDNLRNVLAFPLLEPDPKGLPPAYILALTTDVLRDEAVHYGKWLSASGVNVETVEESHASHGFMFLFGTDDLAMEHLKKIAGFVQGHVQTFNHTALHRGVDQDGEEFNNLEELESLDEDYTSVGRG